MAWYQQPVEHGDEPLLHHRHISSVSVISIVISVVLRQGWKGGRILCPKPVGVEQ